MSKNLLCQGIALVIATMGIVGASLSACGTKNKGWNEEQRASAREMLSEWRDVAYLNALSDAEWAMFAGDVADILEMQWPSYVEFMAMPMVDDSVELVVVTAIVNEIEANSRNMRHIFPYHTLVRLEVLPTGLTHHQQTEFYQCLAAMVDNNFGSLDNFVWGAISSSLDEQAIAHMLRACAAPFWQ